MAIYDGAGGCFFFLFSSFSSLSSLCVACLLFFLLFFVCLPPLLLSLCSLCLVLSSLTLFLLSLLSLFSSLLFSSNRLLSQQQRKVNKDRKTNRKIIDNSGWVWLTGVNLASLKMGLNVAFLFTGPFQGVVNVPAGRSVGLRVYGRTPAGILEFQSRYSSP